MFCELGTSSSNATDFKGSTWLLAFHFQPQSLTCLLKPLVVQEEIGFFV